MQLSKHFSLAEFTNSPTAKSKGISNTPNQEQIANMTQLALHVLEPVREHFGKPVKINSGFRSATLNIAIGGSSSSQHCQGRAADIEIQGVSNRDIAVWITENLQFDQCILEFWVASQGPNSGWVHVSLKKPGLNRREKLIAYKNGRKTVYQKVTKYPE